MTNEEAIYLLKNTAFLAPSLDDLDTAIKMAASALSKVPPADVRGEWLNLSGLPIATVNWSPSEIDYVVCSNCYKNRHVNSGFRAWHKRDTSLMVFCPNCGADMRGLTNDE